MSGLDGMHYDRDHRDYVPDVVAEPANPFTLLEPPRQVDVSTLPTSPKRAFNAALAIGWDARAWMSLGEIAPTFYMSASDEFSEDEFEQTAVEGKNVREMHNIGDVRFAGYLMRIYTIEAADKAIKLGFRAQFIGKEYADKRKAPAGSFDSARLADPAGIPVPMRFDYQPIKVTRGKDAQGRTVETANGFAKRQRDAQGMADRLNRTMNDGTIWWKTEHLATTASEFDAWLAQWASMNMRRPR
jgi:hypothetical protein